MFSRPGGGLPLWPFFMGCLGLVLGYLFLTAQSVRRFEFDDAGDGTSGRGAEGGRLAADIPTPFSEDTTAPVELFEYTPSRLTPGRIDTAPFIGAEELHMTQAHCVGEFRWNKTCLFRNLYMDSKRTWLYFASYEPNSTDAERQTLLKTLQLLVRVEPNQFLRWETEANDFPASRERGPFGGGMRTCSCNELPCRADRDRVI